MLNTQRYERFEPPVEPLRIEAPAHVAAPRRTLKTAAKVAVIASGVVAGGTMLGLMAWQAKQHWHAPNRDAELLKDALKACPPNSNPADVLSRAGQSVLDACWNSFFGSDESNVTGPFPQGVLQCVEAQDACYQATTLAVYKAGQPDPVTAEGKIFAVAASVGSLLVGAGVSATVYVACRLAGAVRAQAVTEQV